MSGVTVHWVSKADMLSRFKWPYFGYTQIWPSADAVCYIRDDLPPRVMKSVEVHERQHGEDRAFLDGRIWHWESRAWAAQIKADPMGALFTVWLTLTDLERAGLYISRLKNRF